MKQPRRRSPALPPLVALAACGAMVPSLASAQTAGTGTGQSVTIGTNVTRSRNLVTQRDTIASVSFDDCEHGGAAANPNDGLFFNIPVNVTGGVGNYLYVWAANAGQDCTVLANRQNATQTCWLARGGAIQSPATTQNVSIRARDILSQAFTSSHTPNFTPGGEALCRSQTNSAAFTITLYFLLTDSTGTNVLGSATYPTTIDMVGPAPPNNVTSQDGDTLTKISWTPATATPDVVGYRVFCDPKPGSEEAGASAPADASGSTMLVCTPNAPSTSTDGGLGPSPPPPPAPPLPDASLPDASLPDASLADASLPDGSLPDASLDAGDDASTAPDAGDQDAGFTCVNMTTPAAGLVDGSSGEVCFSAVLVAGAGGNASASTATVTSDASTDDASVTPTPTVATFQPIDSTLYQCGHDILGTTANGAQIDGLLNGHHYTIGVAGIDKYGNVGPLSTTTCAAPTPVSDFFKTYRDDGGAAGGGFCALVAPGLGGPIFAGIFGVGLLGTLIARRRRR